MLNECNKPLDTSGGINLSDGNLLFDAYHESVRGSKWKASTQKFGMNVLENLSDIQHRLETGTYKTSKQSTFLISERGKTRSIHGNTIEDRIVRHVLCDNVLSPAVDPYLAYDNGASRKGKGVKFARDRFRYHLRRHVDKYGPNGYVLLVDFSKYYDNIPHDIVLRNISKIVHDKFAMDLLREIVGNMAVDVSYMTDSEYAHCMEMKFDSVKHQQMPKSMLTGEKFMRKSLSIGDQSSQVLSIYHPTPVDNYIHNVCGIGNSGRYMDDTYIFSNSKAELRRVLEGIKATCRQLGIFINERKTQICRIDKAFHFLQNMYRVTKGGRIVEKINKKRVTRQRRRLKREARLVACGRISMYNFCNSFRSWMGSFKPVMSELQISNMQTLFEDLCRRISDAEGLGIGKIGYQKDFGGALQGG